jgi:hypothetical protein
VVSLIDVMHHVQPDKQGALIATAAAHVKQGGMLLYKDMGRRPLWLERGLTVRERAHHTRAPPATTPRPIASLRSTRLARSAASRRRSSASLNGGPPSSIGHLKEHHRMGRNHLAHASGDAINVMLAAAGYNFRRLLAWLKFLLLRVLIALGLAARLKLP